MHMMTLIFLCHHFHQNNACLHFTLPTINRGGSNVCTKHGTHSPADLILVTEELIWKKKGPQYMYQTNLPLSLPAQQIPHKPGSCLHEAQPEGDCQTSLPVISGKWSLQGARHMQALVQASCGKSARHSLTWIGHSIHIYRNYELAVLGIVSNAWVT